MAYRYLRILFVLFFPLFTSAQNHQASVKMEAIKMGEALVKKDYMNFIRTTYPKAVNMQEGGEQALIDDLKNQIYEMEKSGNLILKAWPGDPSSIIDTAGELQCTIAQYMEMKIENNKLTTETTLIALSENKGKTWYFIDVADKTIDDIRMLFPNISSKLVLPPAAEPKFEKY